MKILYDHQIFSLQRFGGVSKYFAKLISNLPAGTWQLPHLVTKNEYLKSDPAFEGKITPCNCTFKGNHKVLYALNMVPTAAHLAMGNFSVFHPTDFRCYYQHWVGKRPVVITFHDMNFETYDPHPDLVRLQKKSLNRADHVISISQNTKNDLIERWNIPSDKITVIHHGIDSPLAFDTLARPETHPYILFVGNRHAHKNFEAFARAFAVVRNTFPDLKLLCTKEPFSASETDLFRTLHIEHHVRTIPADEYTMASLYRFAEMFVFPSIYEGFGMPILEAMQYECPVVLSDASCFPEIASDAAAYFDPRSVEAMSEAMSKVLENPAYRSELIAAGNARVQEFSWKRSADRHLEVYLSLQNKTY